MTKSTKGPLFAEVHNVPDDYHFTEEELDRIIAGDMFTPRQDAIMARELQERRKADSEPVVISDDMAYAFHHAMSDSSLGADEVEEIKTGLRAAFANAAPQLSPVLPDLISLFERHISTAGLTDDDSVTVLECKDALRHVLEKSE